MLNYPPFVYVAGAFSGKDSDPIRNRLEVEANVLAAEAMGVEVSRLGAYPIIPHANTANPAFEKTQDYDFWIKGTLKLMFKCDAVLMIPNWGASSGARKEEREARAKNLPVFYSLSELREWLEKQAA